MTYRELVRALHRGETPPAAAVESVLAANGKTADDLLRDWLADPPPKPGDKCAACGGAIKVLNTRRIGTDRKAQYLGCGVCGYRPPLNKQVLPS